MPPLVTLGIEEPGWLLPSTSAERRFVVVSGPDICLTVGLMMALQGAVGDRPLLVIDGANALDPYLLSDLARRLSLPPRALLEQVRISRVFTAYQLEALLEERLPRVRDQLNPYGLLLSGPLEPLLNEDLHGNEAVRVFGRILAALERVLAWSWIVVAACPEQPVPAGREEFFPRIRGLAAQSFSVTQEEAGWRISLDEPEVSARRRAGGEPKSGKSWFWQPAVGALVARRWH